MIIYFSGTHNTSYIARQLAERINQNLLFIPHSDPSTLEIGDDDLGIVCPVYSWGIPPIVADFISRLPDNAVEKIKKRNVWAVLTCGDETGEAPDMLKSILADKGLQLSGGWSVIMPNNYVLLPGFDVDSKEVANNKLDKAAFRVREIADLIMAKDWRYDFHYGPWPRLKTRLVYPLFRKWGIFPKKWRWTQECIRCGKCASVCPVNNIKMVSEHPKWGKNCVSCLACYHICPSHAIEYGNATTRKGQYFCRKDH